jgi:hypothetical protein
MSLQTVHGWTAGSIMGVPADNPAPGGALTIALAGQTSMQSSQRVHAAHHLLHQPTHRLAEEGAAVTLRAGEKPRTELVSHGVWEIVAGRSLPRPVDAPNKVPGRGRTRQITASGAWAGSAPESAESKARRGAGATGESRSTTIS